jgi:hypothetical protein
MKKNIIFFCLIYSFIGLVQAQEKIQPNDLVKAALSEAEIKGLLSSDPNGIVYYNFLTEKAWILMDIPDEKLANLNSYPFLHKINRDTKEISQEILNINDLPTFNLLLYQYKISSGPNYYRIDSSNKVLVIKSQNEIIIEYNSYKK